MRSQAYDDPLRRGSKPQILTTAYTQTSRAERIVTYEPESQIEWSDLIFLPFHPVFKLFVLYSVLIKTTLGPIQSVYPIVYCDDRMDYHPFNILIKYSYWYACDTIYGIDTFLHIIHRQVTDKAMRREHLPKSAELLLCDLISLVPFFHMVQRNPCPPVVLWPNILRYTEFLVIYRVTQYFSLGKTHSYWKLMIGYTVMLCLCLNCVTCFWLVLTEQGLCDRCGDKTKFYDWRAYVFYKLNETNRDFTTYVYGFSYIFSFTGTRFFEYACKPSAIMEYVIMCFFMVASYVLNNFIILPKTLSESMMRLRRICQFYPTVQKIVHETKRRNPNKKVHQKVNGYFILLWKRSHGIYEIPSFFEETVPRYLRIELLQDILWPLFYHSPILRSTSFPFRRWLTHSAVIAYKLPGELLFSSPSASTSLYYIKSGIVQLISLDDGVSPILSVTSGTIFGDISFLIPNIKRKVIVRCLTFCEVYIVQQKELLRGLYKYPDDRQMIIDSVKGRMNHAKVLFASKKSIRGLDRNEDENIAWIKRRWWEIRDHIDHWSKANMRKSKADIYKKNLPGEEAIWHCAKYIGQLVLCNPTELQTKSMFTRFKFPWILNPTSKFGYVWHKIVTYTVLLVLCLYPTNLVKPEIPPWFVFFSYYSDVVYAIDIGISLFTAVKREDFATNNISGVIFERCKSATFMLDIASTIWIEELASLAGQNKYYYTLKFNRLIKVYILFYGDYLKWHIKQNPLLQVCKNIALLHFVFLVITSHVVFEMTTYISELSIPYFFGLNLCSRRINQNCTNIDTWLSVTIAWSFEWWFSEYDSTCLMDSYIGIIATYIAFILFVYSRARFMSYLYLKDRDETLFQTFVANITRYYKHYRIHPDLLKRLDRYFICHWKYYRGVDVINSNTLRNEPLEVYWKAQGQVAKKIIASSPAFAGADPRLVTDLAYAAKILILPKKSNIIHFGFEAKIIVWVMQGYIKSEYHSVQGETINKFSGPGDLLCPGAVLLGRKSLGTYITHTDCEIMYIPMSKFLYILKKYAIEYSYIETCIKEFGPLFDDKLEEYILLHRDYQVKLKDRIVSSRMSTMAPSNKTIGEVEVQENRSLPFQGDFWGDPQSTFLQSWMLFRTIVVYISIVSASALGGVGAASRWIFMMISAFCDSIAWIDIIIKLCIPYYNEDGILVTDKRKCFLNYLTKAFVLDIIGALPWFELVRILLKEKIDIVTCFLINTMCKFAHLYILFAYFDYISDLPTVNVTLFMIVKWQLVNILIVLGSSHYFMVNCVDMEFENGTMKLINMTLRPQCWMPDYVSLPKVLSWDEFHLIFAQSLSFAENGMLSMNFGRFHLDRSNLTVGIVLFGLGLLFWFITCYTLTHLLLSARGDTIFQNSVGQLQRFLKNERVEKPVIEKVVNHFKYYWTRTKGINIQKQTNQRIGVVFQQDLNYYFYKKTFSILDSILKGGEIMQRQLAAVSASDYFLPGHDIFRENDLISHVCIVHRGKVAIYKNQKKVIVLTKGDIFGQLTGARIRPVRVTATADDYADVLYIDYKAFRSIITTDVKHTILRSPQQRNDFMATKNIYIENPCDSVQYLLRGRKLLLLPFTLNVSEASHGTWYSHWLHFVWLLEPFFTVAVVFLFVLLPKYDYAMHFNVFCALTAFDLFYVINCVMEFFVIELVVKKQKCTFERIGGRIFASWKIYSDILTIVVPIASFFTLNWRYQLAKLLRLRHFYEFEVTFCRGFKNRWSPFLLRFALLILTLHISACGWIYFGCRDIKRTFQIIDMRNETSSVDFSQWMHPDDRSGCARVTHNMPPDYKLPSFVVPRFWAHDYILAISYILLLTTQTAIDTILTNTLAQVYYKVFITFVLYVVSIHIMSFGINYAYAKYRELYQYDYQVQTITTYFKDCGLCPSLAEIFNKYTEQLWNRQKGDKLPEIAYRAPSCLRNEMFSALYIHHLEAPPTYRELPSYFKQQLAARFQRIVVFPGKCIVREGDTFNTTYFIHEGEVEKWYSDTNGESKLLSVLYTNGYFGVVPGLINNINYEFSYFARTVVDLVFLNLPNWIDLLDGYPAIKKQLYEATHDIRKQFSKNQWGKTFSAPKLTHHRSTITSKSNLIGHVQP